MAAMTRQQVIDLIAKALTAGQRPDLSGFDLSGIGLSDVDLSNADLRDA